jgi:hypothetical protein
MEEGDIPVAVSATDECGIPVPSENEDLPEAIENAGTRRRFKCLGDISPYVEHEIKATGLGWLLGCNDSNCSCRECITYTTTTTTTTNTNTRCHCNWRRVHCRHGLGRDTIA